MPTERDPFKPHREKDGVLPCDFQGESVPMILRHAEVRAAAKDWKTFSSDAPFRVPIPSEEDVRSVRQLPIETDPPEHKEFRKIVDPFFKRAKNPEVIAKVESLIGGMIDRAMGGELEVVHGFALPVQSHALTYLLDVDESEAEEWIGWGTHVFHVGGEPDKNGSNLERYIDAKIDAVLENPGEDFFSALTLASYQDRKLTREEMHGFANLTFAGGRDTVINTIASVIAYLAKNSKALDFLREDPKRIVNASEEFFRTVSPLTHIGRVCPVTTDVQGVEVKPKGRASLCWASANFDADAFEAPEEVRLDRKPNPHVAFGAGVHLCLGAPHARLITRTLLKELSERVKSIEIIEAKELVETAAAYSRTVGYDTLRVELSAL